MLIYLLTIVTLFSKFIMIRIFSVITNKRVKEIIFSLLVPIRICDTLIEGEQ